MPSQRKFKFIGCEVLYREACYLAATCKNHVDIEFLKKGLHDVETCDMLAKVQSIIDSVDPEEGYEAILLGYARCNNGVVGLTARDTQLVIPRAHDCISLFFGSRQQYKEYFDANPGTYFMTSGWSERENFGECEYSRPAYGMEGVMGKIGLAEPYEKMVEKYGKEQADFIMETLGDWRKNYSKCCYIEMGICDEAQLIQEAREKAAENNWEFELIKGDLGLLKNLFDGQWDEDFVTIPAGGEITSRNDEFVLDSDANT